MALNLEEQEQLDTLKTFWRRYGLWISIVVIVVLGAYTTWNVYQYWQNTQSEKASALFTQFKKAVATQDIKRVARSANDLAMEYGATFFAQQAALQAAKMLYEADQRTAAKEHLQWLVQQTDDYGLVDVARLRLAALLLETKAYSEALSVLQTVQSTAYLPLAEAAKGDIYNAQDKTTKAIAAYENAYRDLPLELAYRVVIGFKLNALGVDPDASKASADIAAAAS